MLYQTLDPLHWPVMYYMDVGCYLQPVIPEYPLPYYTGDDIESHLSTGQTIDSVNYAFMPGHETPRTFAGVTVTTANGLSLITDGDGKYYDSPVCKTESKSSAVIGSKQPHRWTGRARLWAQSLQGVGKALSVDPDAGGLLVSDDFRFYQAVIGSASITITPLKTSAALVGQLNTLTLTDEEETRILSLAMSRLEVDTAKTAYTVGDLSALDDTGSPVAYGWHFSYTDNECSIVNIAKHSSLEQWVNTLAKIEFTIPTAAAETSGSKVSAVLTIEETGDFRQPSKHVLWSYLGDDLLLLTCAKYLPEDGTEMTEGVGTNTPVYVYYLEDGNRAVLRHTKSGPASSTADTEPTKDPACSPSSWEYSWATQRFNVTGSGGWSIENTGVSAANSADTGVENVARET